MAKDLGEQLARIGHKAELLVTRQQMLLKQNADLRQQLDDCRAQVIALQGQLQKANMELEHLRISSALSPDSKTVAETRAFISNLVREIDACVDQLVREV